MKAGPVVIGQLLQQRWRFCVPIYQRHYVWTLDKQWAPFWEDIRTKAIERLEGRERRFSHFMGAVVLETRGGFSAKRVPSSQVVDGQQRLTTFQLFLSAVRDFANLKGFNSTAERVQDYLLNDKPQQMEEPSVEVFKVWPTEADREMFIDILTLGRMKLRKKYPEHFYKTRDQVYCYRTTPRLIAAYGFFYDRIRHAVETDDLEDELTMAPEPEDDPAVSSQAERDLWDQRLDAVWQALVEEFKVVEIVLEEGDDAQVIFETLNERGQPLLAADLVRNNIFQRADALWTQGEPTAEQLFASYWKLFEQPWWEVEEKQGRYRKPRIEFFIAAFISGQIAGEINLSKLFSEYKSFLKTRRYDSVVDELKELNRYGRIYQELITKSGDAPLAAFAQKLAPWDQTTLFPLVLRLWASGMDIDEKTASLDLLLSFVVRRAVCDLTNKNYNKFFLSVVAQLDASGWSLEQLERILLTSRADSARFPDNGEFRQSWLAKPAYRLLQPVRAKAVLEEIERFKRTAWHETTQLSSSLTVEHILPDEWRTHWPLPSGIAFTDDDFWQAFWRTAEDDTPTGLIVKRQRLKHSFGNLTLLKGGLNASCGNGPFPDKLRKLNKHSLLVLNKEILEFTTWGEDEIIQRGETLFEVAKQIWKAPHGENGSPQTQGFSSPT